MSSVSIMRYMEMRFSTRTAWETTETELARALRERKEAELPLLDLTASNPTLCGFEYDASAILAPLSARGALQYDPNPQGMILAREAVCGYYRDHGAEVGPEQVFLTTSTSEAYSYIFRLVCDAGDEVLIAQPSYPLFDFLAALDDVRLTPYSLFYDHGWHLDIEDVRQRITPRTRAIALVHPNNPTGHFTKLHERRQLEELCAEHRLVLIVDEVFLDYPLLSYGSDAGQDTNFSAASKTAQSFAIGPHPALTFVLSGMSKIAGLPQMKAAWMTAFGPQPELTEALSRLEIIADTFLSMNAPVQYALPCWIEQRRSIQQQISKRASGNLQILDELLARRNIVSRLEVEAGWYAVLRVPAIQRDEDLALHLIQSQGISIHPGHFFGFSSEGWLVVSLLTPQKEFRLGIEKILSLF